MIDRAKLTFGIWLPFIASVLLLVASCSTDTGKYDPKVQMAHIDSLENILFNGDGSLVDREAATHVIKVYAQYYQRHQPDPIAIDMLFKAGEVSMGIGDGRLAVKYFGTLSEKHPDFEKAPEAMFLMGFCEETLNGDLEQAKAFYENFIATHPKHVLAGDAKFSIENLGKSDDELIKMFEQLNASK
jgi:TolA-binding protein